jgi:hypothetical protein
MMRADVADHRRAGACLKMLTSRASMMGRRRRMTVTKRDLPEDA